MRSRGSKRPQESVRRPPEAPRERPRCRQEPPRAVKSVPGALQEAPGALQKDPGGPSEAPGRPHLDPPDAPGGPKWDLPGAPRRAPGVLLERSWRLLRRSRGALDGSWRLLAAPRALPGRFWRSPGALLGPFGALGPHSRAFFSFRKLFVLGFCATAAETATASWSLALETLDQLGL